MHVTAGNAHLNRNIVAKTIRDGRQVVVTGLETPEQGIQMYRELRRLAGCNVRRSGPYAGGTMRLERKT